MYGSAGEAREAYRDLMAKLRGALQGRSVHPADLLVSHMRHIARAGHRDIPPTPGVPEALITQFCAWADDRSTSREEIAAALSSAAGPTRAIGVFVKALLARDQARTAAVHAKVAEYEATGRKVVEYLGITAAGTALPRIHWLTGQRIDDYDGPMVNIDHVADTVRADYTELPQVPGIPPGLADTLQSWLGWMGTPDHTLAEISGLTATEVTAIRRAAQLAPGSATTA